MEDSQERTGCDLKMKMHGEDNLGDNTPSSHKQKEISQKVSEDGGDEMDVKSVVSAD